MVAAAIRTIFAQHDAAHVHERLGVNAGMLGRQSHKVETMLRDAPVEATEPADCSIDECLDQSAVASALPDCRSKARSF
jgi:hypothetical protein